MRRREAGTRLEKETARKHSTPCGWHSLMPAAPGFENGFGKRSAFMLPVGPVIISVPPNCTSPGTNFLPSCWGKAGTRVSPADQQGQTLLRDRSAVPTASRNSQDGGQSSSGFYEFRTSRYRAFNGTSCSCSAEGDPLFTNVSRLWENKRARQARGTGLDAARILVGNTSLPCATSIRSHVSGPYRASPKRLGTDPSA